MTFLEPIAEFYWPLATYLARHRERLGRSMMLGINGPQGAGKSTLARILELIFTEEFNLPTAVVSLDDLYLTRAQRVELSREVHPLLITRGVPATHDITLGMATLESLSRATNEEITRIPRFDKSCDERVPVADWDVFRARAEVVILEGWCVGARPEQDDALLHPINELERTDDPNGVWRNHVNAALAGTYQALFAKLDHLIFFRTPGFECVLAWRLMQERKLERRLRDKGQPRKIDDTYQLMDENALRRFTMHFERLTKNMLLDMPAYADTVIDVDEMHQIVSVSSR